MLLPEKPNPVQKLPGSRPGGFKALPELCVFELEPFDALGCDLRASSGSFHGFHPGFGLQRTAAEAGQLVAEVTDELLKLAKIFHVRTIAVGFQVCSRVR
jgi:hypothetical protein